MRCFALFIGGSGYAPLLCRFIKAPGYLVIKPYAHTSDHFFLAFRPDLRVFTKGI